MLLVHTACAHVPGLQQKRKRSYYAAGKSETAEYRLNQDQAHWLYRGLFNVIDILNRARHGEVTPIWDVWRTLLWETRLFMTLLSMVFCNATFMYALLHPETETNGRRQDKRATPQHERNRLLAIALIENPYIERDRADTRATTRSTAGGSDVHHRTCQLIPDKHIPVRRAQAAVLGRNGRASRPAKKAHTIKNRQLVCGYCFAARKERHSAEQWSSMEPWKRKSECKTRYQCACGVPVCVQPGKDCYFKHICEVQGM